MKAALKSIASKVYFTTRKTLVKTFLHIPKTPHKLTTSVWGNGTPDASSGIPKIVWMYWHTETMPEVCDLCFKRVKRLNPDYKVHFLNAKTVLEFLPELETIAPDDKNMPLAHYSDAVRLMLLSKFGGYWLDASIIINGSLDYFDGLVQQNKAEFVCFTKPVKAFSTSINYDYPITENWFLGAVKGSQFINDWKNEFLKCITSPAPGDYYKSNSLYGDYVQYIPGFMREYLLAYISSQAIMRADKNKYRLVFLNAYESGFLYSDRMMWDDNLIVKLLANFRMPAKLPIMIKLIGGTRSMAQKQIDNADYQSDSILADLVKER